MAVVNRISEQEYREIALTEPNHFWELWDGVPVEKPWMSMRHNAVAAYLGAALINQLDRGEFCVSINGDRTRVSSRSYYIPDVIVVPTAYQLALGDDPWVLGAYAGPLPLVVEVWSPSTGHYDVATKLRGYQERGDLEVWFIHSVERTLTVWLRQTDGSYSEELYRGGIVSVISLPGISIDLDALLDG